MNIIKILRKNRETFVRKITIGELDETKLSNKFLSHNLSDDVIVNVKCHENGEFDLRGKKGEYRIITEDDVIDALLPCPCCGSEPILQETEGCDFVISCNECGLGLFDDMKWGVDGYDAKSNVIEKWNKRIMNSSETSTSHISDARERSISWWSGLGDNFLLRIIVQGELTTKYYGQMRKTSSLTGREIEYIYISENINVDH